MDDTSLSGRDLLHPAFDFLRYVNSFPGMSFGEVIRGGKADAGLTTDADGVQ